MNDTLRRVDFYLDKNQFEFLGKLPGTISEHLRRAVDEYVKRLEATSYSTSPKV